MCSSCKTNYELFNKLKESISSDFAKFYNSYKGASLNFNASMFHVEFMKDHLILISQSRLITPTQ